MTRPKKFFEVSGCMYCIVHYDFAIQGTRLGGECYAYDSSDGDDETCVLRDLFIRTADRFHNPHRRSVP